jgi:hypothetical protein
MGLKQQLAQLVLEAIAESKRLTFSDLLREILSKYLNNQ